MLNNGTTATPDEKSPWVQPGFIAAAVVVALLVVLGVILAVTGGNDASPATDGAKPAPPPAVTPPANADASGCGLDPGSQAIPTTAPDATWRLVGTVATPAAPRTVGPGRRHGPVSFCFAHSPTGALFASVNIYAALNALVADPPADPRPVLRELIADTPDRDALLKDATKSSTGDPGASAGVQVAGFNIIRYEPSEAVVDLVFRVDRPGASGYVHAASTLKWERGDWRLALARGAQPFDSLQQVPDLQGYTAWSGV
jgi:hypothetical protein